MTNPQTGLFCGNACVCLHVSVCLTDWLSYLPHSLPLSLSLFLSHHALSNRMFFPLASTSRGNMSNCFAMVTACKALTGSLRSDRQPGLNYRNGGNPQLFPEGHAFMFSQGRVRNKIRVPVHSGSLFSSRECMLSTHSQARSLGCCLLLLVVQPVKLTDRLWPQN